MGSAMFTGVTGLQAFQRRLDVIASNIANVNTTGYRSSRVLFEDLFSQTLNGGSAPEGTFGGTNPQQVGLGVQVGEINVDHSQGSLVSTGISSDLAVQGQGFFVLSNGVNQTFTRDGSFGVNSNGLLIDPASGLFVQGFTADLNGVIDTNAPTGNISIPIGGSAIVQPTSLTSLIGNLDADAQVGDEVIRTIRVFDSLGAARDVELTFTKSVQLDDAGTLYNAWTWRAEFEGLDVTNTANTGAIIFENDGTFRAVGDTTGANFTAAAPGTQSVSIPLAAFPGPSIPDTPFEFEIDMASMTELSGLSEVTNPSQNGFPRGVLESFTIGDNGVINGVFTNGLTRVIGQVALAGFSNVGALVRVGGNQFQATAASGLAQIGVANSGGRGSINAGVLESSNVDLGTEFSNMIITQRGFQANARTITAADTLLQEAVNLVR